MKNAKTKKAIGAMIAKLEKIAEPKTRPDLPPVRRGQIMSAKKYYVFPGDIWSQTDGDCHYITAADLMRLYRVNPAECVIIRPTLDQYQRSILYRMYPGLIPLFPSSIGDYSRPDE